ncbi:family 43 glycosylhydrolase [Fulvivirgaceae bacterium BMA12]|uniref:Family 43 glycosylhydrolase n=1 Tax=Agaribacillus aureus TaxID=3051825 RepID=A0ABT8L0E6_9BACT|nr:family 43 glycosylhydrolase [Fulvivirgaceae bacterium BMA12]
MAMNIWRSKHAGLSIVLCLSLMLPPLLCAQSASHKGTVTCGETGRLLKDVYVRVIGKEVTALTDANGAFELFLGNSGTKTIIFDKPGFMVLEKRITSGTRSMDVKLRPRKISAASFRWVKHIESKSAYGQLTYKEDPAWQADFNQTSLEGDFASDSNMVRRDPSAIIKVGDLYYFYYTRGVRYAAGSDPKVFPWDQCDIWYATSKDGWKWEERGLAVKRGTAGSYDDRSVFTPEILAHQGKYYLVYQAVKSPYVDRVRNTIGMAIADSPSGPWIKLAEPILRTTGNGEWLGEEDNRMALKKGDFDSHKVHDPCLVYYRDKFYLYYKGQRIGEHRFYGEREIKWGVAIADRPEGPYVKSAFNPITNTGHEVCVWPFEGGIALLHTLDGPEANTIQWAPDGINFEIMSTVANPPEAPGNYRSPSANKEPLEGIRWGLCHVYGGDNWRTGWNYIKRFDLVQKNQEE